MLEIFPAIDILGGKCVRLRQGVFDDATTYSDDVILMARRWQSAGARWLHIVDLDGAKHGCPNAENLSIIRSIIQSVGLPIQFGGGARSLETIAQLLDVGIARVVVGTALAKSEEFAADVFRNFSEQVAVGVDAKDGIVAVHGWQEQSGEQATSFVQRMATLGAKRFIFTDIARDGMLEGINFESLCRVAESVSGLPVIASGGVASLTDIARLVTVKSQGFPNIEGVIVGKALYAGTLRLFDAMTVASQQ